MQQDYIKENIDCEYNDKLKNVQLETLKAKILAVEHTGTKPLSLTITNSNILKAIDFARKYFNVLVY